MKRILFLFPSLDTAEEARNILTKYNSQCIIDHCLPHEAPEVAQRYATQGIDIICARGGIMHLLENFDKNIIKVYIPITAFEIIKAIHIAKAYGKKIAVIAHEQMVIGIDFLASSMGESVKHYVMKYNQNYEHTVQKAIKDGSSVIMGGVLACQAAQKYNIPSSLITFGEEGLLQALKEATQIRDALEVETVKRQFLETLIESSNDGIIAIDSMARITHVNNRAERLLRLTKDKLLHENIVKIIPKLRFSNKARTEIAPQQPIITLFKNKMLCDISPIEHEKKQYGAIIRLQKTSSIQEKEGLIRQELYTRGHVAKFRFSDIIGNSKNIHEAVHIAKDYAETVSNVLILGETGTGKEVFAQSIHNASPRAHGPFVAINCAAIPTHLLESELFGYVGGAFTGANKEGKAGLLEVAHNGTIFLDEMAELDYINQGRLLRFCQERAVVRLGSHKVVPVNVRIIVATNKNLEELITKNSFRDDLYYRLNVLRLELPPLRSRTGDVPHYVKYFLQQFMQNSPHTLQLSAGALRLLHEYSWPGNVRECLNMVERIVARFKSGTVSSEMMQSLFPTSSRFEKAIPSRSQRQKDTMLQALEDSHGNYSKAAELLNINRSTLYRRMKKYGLEQ